MKLLSIMKEGKASVGIRTDKGIVDIEKALSAYPAEGRVPTDVMSIIENGQEAVAALQSYVERLPADGHPDFLSQEDDISWGPCVTSPSKIICVGLNYRKHAEETNAKIPEFPILFNKFSNTLTGHLQEIAVPNVTKKMDYECELAIVIGKRTKAVSKEAALDHVFGYAVVNDLSARDLQLRTSQWMLGKVCDGFSPIGPYLVTADEVGNPNDLAMRTLVNGEIRQNSNTSDMIFYCDEIISYISQHLTLLPGDIILTGTPEGVVLGYPPEKQIYLKPGDEMTIEIEKLGRLTNRLIAES
jgi:2-keto-4-pentenoate hydratase/2-oxohepta-3-ene-1,7-dioic acid hydratase in catechol pathway